MAEFIMEPEVTGYARIKVIGIGGGGCNAVDWMFDTGLQNVDFHVLNTDTQALKRYKVPNKHHVGVEITKGRGCGGKWEVGQACMEEERSKIEEILEGTDIVFITAGLGGGTGTGGSPVIASVAKSMGILTVGVVTRPFRFEGPSRSASADKGLQRLRKECDTIIVVSNDRLLDVAGGKTTLRDAFGVANNVLSQAVQSISDLITIPGLINVDFNDICAVMGDRGGAVMGVGVGKGENRAHEAVKKATSSPLLEKIVIDGATGVLVSITGGSDMTLGHVNDAMIQIYEVVDPEAQIIFGAVVDESVQEEMRVTIIATGFPDDPHATQQQAVEPEAQQHERHAHPQQQPPPPPRGGRDARSDSGYSQQQYAPEAPREQRPAPARAHAQGHQRRAPENQPRQDVRHEEHEKVEAYSSWEPAPQASAPPSQTPVAASSAAPSARQYGGVPASRGHQAPRKKNGRHDAKNAGRRSGQAKQQQEQPNISLFNPSDTNPGTGSLDQGGGSSDMELPTFLRRRKLFE